MTIFETWADSAPGRNGGLEPSSKLMYASMWGKFERFLAGRARTPINCNTEDITAFLATLVSAASAIRYTKLIESVLAQREGVNPAQGLSSKLPKPKRAKPTAPNKEQTTRILEVQPTSWLEVRDLALAAVALGSGAKPGELAALQVSDLQLSESPPYFTVESHGRVRAVPLAVVAREPLTAWLRLRTEAQLGEGPVFCSGKGAPLSPSALWRACARVFKAAGVNARQSGGQSLRNAFAIRQLRLGKPITVVQGWLGHEQVTSTLVYKRLIVNPNGIEAE